MELGTSKGDGPMTKRLHTAAIAALLALSMSPVANVARAMPIASARVINNAAPPAIETVQWRGGGWGYDAAALGAIAGTMLAPYAYGPAPYYGPPAHYGPSAYYAPGYAASSPANAMAYCTQRYRSYDPGSGTFVGYDGMRHPCP